MNSSECVMAGLARMSQDKINRVVCAGSKDMHTPSLHGLGSLMVHAHQLARYVYFECHGFRAFSNKIIKKKLYAIWLERILSPDWTTLSL